MLSETFKKATLVVNSEGGIQPRQSMRGLMFRAGASDFEFSQQDSWVGSINSYVAYRPQIEVGSVNVRRRADGSLRLILSTPPASQELSADDFRKMEQGVANAMDWIFNRLVGGREKK